MNIDSTKTGVNMDAVELMDEVVLETAKDTQKNNSLDCAKLVIFWNVPGDSQFMAGVRSRRQSRQLLG